MNGEPFQLSNAPQMDVGQQRRLQAEDDLPEAISIAEQHGFVVKQCSESHYQVRSEYWLVNLYPGNQRWFSDRNQKRILVVSGLPEPWRLIDVVKTIAAHGV